MNAVFYRTSINVKDCTIYVTRFPCVECAIIIIQSGIKNVVYLEDPKCGKKKNKTAKNMFAESGLQTRKHPESL